LITLRSLAGRLPAATLNEWRGPLAAIIGPYAGLLPLVAALGAIGGLLEGIGIGLLIPLVALLLAHGVPADLPGPIRDLAMATSSLDR
jgi:hypothetical protein